MPTSRPRFHSARPLDLDVPTLYRILRLREAVFDLEQRCTDLDLDGRDLEPDTCWWWAADGERVVATARVLREDDGVSIGRVAVHPTRRRHGLGTVLMETVLAEIDRVGDNVRLHAQEYLLAWYRSLGFVSSGTPFMEAGIPHLTMRRVRPA